MMPTDRPEYLTLPDAAAILGIAPQNVHRWLARQPEVATVDVARAGTKKRELLVKTEAVIARREERLASGQRVGAIPASWTPPPAVPDVPPMPIGLMVWRPF